MKTDAVDIMPKRKEERKEDKGTQTKKKKKSLPEWAESEEALWKFLEGQLEWKRIEVSRFVKYTEPTFPLTGLEFQNVFDLIRRSAYPSAFCYGPTDLLSEEAIVLLNEHEDGGVNQAYRMEYHIFQKNGHEKIWDTRNDAIVWSAARRANLEHPDWHEFSLGSHLCAFKDAKFVFVFLWVEPDESD